MPPIYKRDKYKNVMSSSSYPYNKIYKIQKVQISITMKHHTLTIQLSQKVLPEVSQGHRFFLKNSTILSFQGAHQITKGAIFQTLWTQLIFIPLLQAINTSFTLDGWSHQRLNAKAKSEETHHQCTRRCTTYSTSSKCKTIRALSTRDLKLGRSVSERPN